MLNAFQEFRIGDVLACENHPFVQLGLKASLKETLPHLRSLRLAGSGKEALRLAQEKRPDLVIVDLGLPDMSCLELIQRLREIWTDLRSTEFVVRLNNDPHGPCWLGAVDAEDGGGFGRETALVTVQTNDPTNPTYNATIFVFGGS